MRRHVDTVLLSDLTLEAIGRLGEALADASHLGDAMRHPEALPEGALSRMGGLLMA